MRLKEIMYAVMDLICLAYTVEHVAGCCDPSNELSGFLTQLSSSFVSQRPFPPQS